MTPHLPICSFICRDPPPAHLFIHVQRLESVVEAAEGNWDTVLYMSYATIQKNAAFKEML